MTQRVSASNLAFITRTSLFEIAALNNRAEIVRMLVSLGESAFALRQWGRLEQVGKTLTGLPLPLHYKAIGSYYSGIAASPFNQGDIKTAIPAFERAAENAPPVFQARAILSLGAMAAYARDRNNEARFYKAAIDRATRADCQDIHTIVEASRMMAVLHSLEGDHGRALDELENLWPMVRMVSRRDPVAYLKYLNSLAVELGEAGRVEHACKAISIVTAASFTLIYPELQETADDLAAMQQQAIIISVPDVEPQPEPQSKTSHSPESLFYFYRLWFPARPARLALPAHAQNIAPNPLNTTLARYIKCARIRAPDSYLKRVVFTQTTN